MEVSRARHKRRAIGIESLWGWIFLLPTMGGVLVFYIWPVLRTFYYSFTKWGAFGRSVEWTGLSNYERLLSDPDMPRALFNSLLYTFVILLGVPLALVFASLINRPGLRFATVYRVAFFMPYVAMPAAIAMVWRMIFAGDYGVLNWVLGFFGIRGPSWLTDSRTAIVAVGVVGVWASFGFIMIVLSAGLKSIPPELYEAASLDGASNWRQFRSITLPLLSPSIFFVVIMQVISGLQLFDLLFTIMGGNSNPAMAKSQSLVYLFYNSSFIANDKGYGSAIAMAILLFVGLVTIVQFILQRKWVYYD